MNRWVILAGVLLAFLVGSYWYLREDPELAEIRGLEAKLQEMGGDRRGRGGSEEALALRDEIRQKINALPESKRQQFEAAREDRMAAMLERDQQRMAAFFAMPKEKQLASIDEEIDRGEARRKAREQDQARRAARGNGAPAEGAPAEGAAAGNAVGRGGGSAQSGGRSNRNQWGNMTPEQRKQRTRQRLDRTTPQYRAQRSEYARMVQERRKERGLPPASWRDIRRSGGFPRREPPPQPAAPAPPTA